MYNEEYYTSIMVFISNYLPGYKSGGPLRSIVNMVDRLGKDFKFNIITTNHDFGEKEPYRNIKSDEWRTVGNANVFYTSQKKCNIKEINKIINTTEYELIYLNGFFDPTFTIKVLICRRFNLIKKTKFVIAPRGDLEYGSLRLKYLKKIIYIKLAKFFGLYKELLWQASCETEAEDIKNVMGIEDKNIQIAINLPPKSLPTHFETHKKNNDELNVLRIIYLSRLSREKNLDYALQVLQLISTNINFDIYGTKEDYSYWEKCQKIIDTMPSNVSVNYKGSIENKEVIDTFGKYDLYLFPTSGENYGHSIVESLLAGTPILISDQTPWRNLEKDGLGWDISLNNKERFVHIIEKYALTSFEDRYKKRNEVIINIKRRLEDPKIIEDYKKLFNK